MAQAGHRFEQDVLALAVEFGGENTHPRRIASGLGQRAHQACPDHIIDQNDERNRRCRLLGSARRSFPAAHNSIDLGLDLLLSKLSKLFGA
jgi:hypothetical protein